MKVLQYIIGLLCCSCIVLSANSSDGGLFSEFKHKRFLPQEEIERKAILLGEDFINKILAKKAISLKEEQKLFGPYGGILGESLYASLGYSSVIELGERRIFIDPAVKSSPLGTLLIKKLNPILANKKRFTYCLGRDIYTYDLDGIARVSTTVTTFLFIRAIPESSSAFHNDENGITMVIALRDLSNKKDGFYIDLVDSYIGHVPLYKFLGFQGKFASDLKLPAGELLQLKEDLGEKSN